MRIGRRGLAALFECALVTSVLCVQVAAATAGVCVGAAFYAFSVKRASESPPLRKIEVPVGSTPVLLITDIGADIDDTFAMM